MPPNKSQAEELVGKIPPLRELFSRDTNEAREAWIKADPSIFLFLGMAAYWFEKEGRWDVVRELNRLGLMAAEAFGDDELPSGKIDEVKERLLAEAHGSLGDVAERDGAYFVALQERLAAADYFDRSVQRRAEKKLSPFSEKDLLFGGGGEGLRASYYLKVHDSYLRIGEREVARQYERKAYEAIATSTNLDNYSVARTFEAIEAERYGARKEARDILKRAIEHVFAEPFPRQEFIVPLAAMVHLYVLAARYAAEDRDFEAAFEHIDQATEINTEKKQWVYCIDCLVERAEIALNARNEPQVRRSLDSLDALIADNGMETLIPPNQLYKIRMVRGEHAVMPGSPFERVQGLKRAEQNFSGAIQIVRELRTRAFSQSDKLSISHQQRDAYQGMLDVVGELFTATNDTSYAVSALRIAEQSGAQLFLERAAENRMRNVSSGAADEMATLSLLEHTRNKIAQSVYEGETASLAADQRIAARNELEKLIRERDGLIEWIKNKNPVLGYAVAPDAVELDEIRALLGEDQRILRYATTGSSLLAWVIGRDDVTMQRIPLDMAALAGRIAEFRRLLTEPSEEAVQEAFEAGSGLFMAVVAPLLSELKSARQLFVITSGALSSMPFEALVVGDKYWLEEAEINYAPSLSILALMLRSYNRTWLGPAWFLGLGDPKYPDADEAGRSETSALEVLRKRGLELSPLPGSRIEVEGINRLFGPGNGRVMLGEQCTKESLKAMHLTDYSFIHFAVHGFLPGELRAVEQPALALTPTEADDGLLTAQDVASLNIRSYLTVLSACNTGIGPTVASEGMISLTRAMLTSGSDHVLASLWEVSDAATAMLMVDLYQRLLAGDRPALALREAKLALMKKTVRVKQDGEGGEKMLPGRWPCFWGAFLLHGGNGVARFVEPNEAAPLGSDRAPVKAAGAVGERAYLGRLRSADGSTPKWQRRGNIGVGVNGNIIDLYDIEEANGNVVSICMDMYYPGYNERRAVPGFTLAP